MTNYGDRTMHRVLQIPELLDMVFSYLDPPSNAVNARICKKWSEIALDVLWRDVDDLGRLFGLLVPFTAGTGLNGMNDYEFTRLPEASDWKRFERYGKRVRRLVYQTSQSKTVLKQSVFDDVARTRTRLEILPNMHTLHWKGPLGLCVLFMHKGVKNFAVHLPPDLKTISPRPFFEDLAARMPNITHIDIRSIVPMHNIESEMISLFDRLHKIQKATFPRFYVTSRFAETLSRLQNLGVVEFQYLDEQGSGMAQDVTTFSPVLTEGAFPLLWDLSAGMLFNDAANFLDAAFAPTNLTMLYIDSPLIETPTAVRRLFGVVAENCQLLTFLALVSLRDPSSADALDGHYDPESAITIDTIKPVFKIPNLTSLEIVHQYPLAFKKEDIELLASSWPSLETLLLNTEPVHSSKANLTLDDLLPFAQHCPKLTHLGLFIDSTTVDSNTLSLTAPVSVQFQSLNRLSMGVSLINDDNAVTLFLSQILPLGCKLDSGITWDETFGVHEDISSIIQERCELWGKVSELLPVLTKLRMAERVRTKNLELELEDLKMRTQVLRDSAMLGVKLDVSTCVMI